MGNVAARSNAAEYSLRIVWSLARWIEDTRGRAALARLADQVGLTVDDFDGTTCWIDNAQLQAILATRQKESDGMLSGRITPRALRRASSGY